MQDLLATDQLAKLLISECFICLISDYVSVCSSGVFGDAEKVSVIEGKSVTLHTGVTEKQSSDVIEWRFNGNLIAKISGESIKTDGAYRDGMNLDKKTGDLKITNIRTSDSGEYLLKIRNTRGSPEKTFNVSGECLTVL